MIKVTCLNICERAWQSLCKKGYFIPKSAHSDKICKECKIIIKREKRKKKYLNSVKKKKKNSSYVKRKLSRFIKKVNMKFSNKVK